MKKNTINSKLAVPNYLKDTARQEITAALNPLVADAFALYIKTKNYHWHVSGPHFRDYHLLFDEQAGQIFNMIDVIAERVRKLGGLTIHSVKEIHQLQRVKDDDESFVKPQEMLDRLILENHQLIKNLLAAHRVCDKHQDVATSSVLDGFIDEAERRVWFLFESAQR